MVIPHHFYGPVIKTYLPIQQRDIFKEEEIGQYFSIDRHTQSNYSEDDGCSYLNTGDITNDSQNICNWSVLKHQKTSKKCRLIALYLPLLVLTTDNGRNCSLISLNIARSALASRGRRPPLFNTLLSSIIHINWASLSSLLGWGCII